jgi:ABC-type sugar transport system ATPase subunit
MLEIKELNYSNSQFNLTIDKFRVNDKCIHTLLGNSGAGKSTLLNLIAGHLKPNTGNILLKDHSVLNIKPNERSIALVFQNSLLFPHMNVVENIGYGLKVNKKDKKEIHKKVNLWLNRMDLVGYGQRMPNELTGGEKKRVAIARALITEPELVLMDEPLNGLDPKLRNEMLELIKKIQRETSIAILYITHDFEEALRISDQISVIKDGQLIHSGTPKSLLFAPEDLSIIDFFSYYNKKKVFIQNKYLTFYKQRIKIDKNGHYYCILPPQGIIISTGDSGVIVKKHLLKYGNIYQINNHEECFYAFSHEDFNIGTSVDYSIQSEFIRFKKEL